MNFPPLFAATTLLALGACSPPNATGTVTTAPAQTLTSTDMPSDQLTVSTWNLGYAGLGWDADAKSDGGTHLFPPSKHAVDRNLAQILSTALLLQTDVQFYQEVSANSPLSYWRPVASKLETTLAKRLFWFKPEIAARAFPRPIRPRHGTAIATDLPVTETEIIPIIGEDKPMFGLINRHYALQIIRIPTKDAASDWVLINIHLSAFDDGGDLRRAQIGAVFDYAQAQYANGARVIIGGDWNMELTANTFPHQTADEYLFWIHEFPMEQLPKDWQIAIDPSLPSVRTMHKPYVPGENYVTIIDGFITSPNVEIVSVKTIDTGFQMSDHMPVLGNFRATD